MIKTFLASWIALISTAGLAHAGSWGKCPGGTKAIVDRADRIMVAGSSAGIMTMRVVKPHNHATMKMKFWSSGREKMLVRIAAPSRLRGMATLKVGTRVWYYMPRTDRIVRVGSSMLSDSWMGSHFTNDDLIKETEMEKDYTCQARRDLAASYRITLKPKPNAPVVWGKVIMVIKRKNGLPEKVEYYDEHGRLKRIMTFSQARVMDGRLVPTRFVLRPAGKSEYTEISYQKIRFRVRIPARYFSLRGLTR
ncbi:MAG: outer membrane lipoprotein-sorting protein [Deltaproteobacteria bacterium]|nr:outer membrane lipoprotein-sorting protein [Deltaproteobacteria bacterium]